MKKFILPFIGMLCIEGIAQTQDTVIVDNAVPKGYESVTPKKIAHRKGEVYVTWGWNRGWYTDSDIRFRGDDYDFTLEDASASDKPLPFTFEDHLNPGRITIPQTNFKIGYFFKDNWAVSVGVDHMKYVMDQNQTVAVSGYNNHKGYENAFKDGQIDLSDEKFLKFEHTDGLNYINAELEYYPFIYEKGFFQINGILGGGAGVLLPKTNATLMDNVRHDDFHVAGWGINAKVGLELLFWKFFFLRTEGKEGFIDMQDIRTTHNSADKAQQYFFFAEWDYTFGVSVKF